ncbi:AzlC family ABC transporter permease [Acuticoccus kandeliae]|uniref:AzlC family ABC transporter permease n=1 Tax=Acuticoccus kandeliae TaxID=2073160 RepID=UPI000D3E5A96|nr:AzlC family ABC transporter permease [Acuticoccus kandeliae]
MSSSDESSVHWQTWFWRGAGHLFSLPALVLVGAQIGFAALAREAGFSLVQSLILTLTVWALPSQVVFVGIVGAGASLPAVMLAVGLSAVRFMPMVMSWTPVVRTPQTPRWFLLFMSWFVAVTAWVFAMQHLPDLPRRGRMPFFAGFAICLTLMNTAVVGIGYTMLGAMPPVVAAMLVFLTPIYFLMALWGAARVKADRFALVAGLILGPVFSVLAPDIDLLASGLIGGTIAYGLGRLASRKAAS